MKTKTQFMNRILSLVLSIMMVVSMLPASALSVFAADTTYPYAVIDTEAGTVTIDGTLGGKTDATEEDLTALVAALKSYVESGHTTIIVTGSQPAKLLKDGYLIPVVSLAFEQLTYAYQDENIDSYWGAVDLIYQDVTEIVEYEFYVCAVLKSITLPKVTTVGDRGFWACYYLETLTFGSVVTTINDNNGEVFYDLGYEIDGCNLVLNCGQLQAATEYQPNLTTKTWWKDNEWKSITLGAHVSGSDGTCDCGASVVAEVEYGDTATYYATLTDALVSALYGTDANVYALTDCNDDFTIPASVSFYGGDNSFGGNVTNNGDIREGTFNGEVTNEDFILGGTFNATVINHEIINGGTFNGNVTNYDRIYNDFDADRFILGDDFTIENHGTISCDYHHWKDGVCRLCAYACTHAEGTAATCTTQAVCENCGASYGEVGGHTPGENADYTDNGNGEHSYTCTVCGTTVTEDHTLDVTTGVCTKCGADASIATVTDGTNTYYAADAATLNQAVTAILETGSRTFTVELPADTEAGMITAIRRAICDTEGVADGSIHLTLKGVTTIPGTTNWDGVAFGPRNAQWDENNVEIVSHEEVTQLASVNLPDVTEIGAQAFLDCSNLTSITAPKVQFIGDWGLQGTAITSIDMPLLKEARYSAFCSTALTEVSLPSLETAGVIVFGHCKQLRAVDLPKLQNLSQQLFTRCTSLVSVSAPAATSMGINVFKGCSELVSITLPGVTEITNEAFAECTKLENITLGSVITKVNVNLFAGEALSSNITLTLHHDQANAEGDLKATEGTNVEWAGFKWKEVKFAHSYVDGKCTVCGEDCAHTGGTATCKDKAVCDICKTAYGELGGHTYNTAGSCTVCGAACPHSNFDSATGNCTDCETSLAIAKIKTGETTIYYQTADELRTAVDLSGDDQTLTLLADLAIKDTFFFNANGTKNTLDLNGHTLICSDPISERILLGDCELAITGTGSINIFMGADSEGSKIVVGSGVTLNNSLRSAYGGVLDLTNATIPEAGLNVILYSDDWDPTTYNVSDVLLLPADYYFFMDGKAVYTYSGETEGTVLKHTDHSHTYTDNGDGTHDATCSVCGKMVDNEAHTLTYTANGNTIAAACSANCGYSGTATISATGKTYDGNAVEVVVSKTGSLENMIIPVTLTKDSEAFTGEPVNAGAYTASVTLGDKTVSVNFTIAKAEVSITTAPTPNTLTYIGEAQYLISAGEAVGGTMVYSLTENGEYTTSIPQGTNAGDYTVWYYVQGDANHKDSAKDSVAVTIAKATPTAEDFVFAAPTDLIYDGTAKPATITVKDGIVGMGEVNVIYFRYAGMWIDNEREPIYPGRYKVGIWIKEGDNYKAVYSDERIWLGSEFEIKYLTTDAKADISGTMGSNGWYTSDVTLSAPEGYQISKTKYNDGFVSELTFSAEQNETITYYLKDANGDVAEKTVELKIDKTAPAAQYQIGTDGWKQFINTITFGLFCKDYKTVDIEYTDALSGVAEKQYYISSEEITNTSRIAWLDYTDTLSLNATGKYLIYMRVVDNAGNEVILNTEGIVIYEDSVQVTESVSATYNAGTDKAVTVKLNGNTVNAIQNGNAVLTAGTDYTVSADGTITLKASYLDALKAGEYTFTVSYNPQGVETDKVNMTTAFTVKVEKADGKVSNLNISSKTYDGTAVTAPTFDKLGDGAATIEYKVKGADDSTYTTTAPKDAGDYVVRVTVAESENYKAASATAEFTIGRASITGISVKQDGKLTYNGEAQTPTVSTSATTVDGSKVTFTYSTESEGPYSTEIPSFTNAGWTHHVYYRATAENHNASYGSFLVEIEKATVTEPTIASKPYSGSAQTADISDTDLYTVEKNNGGTEKGSYDVVLKLKNSANYKWSTTNNAEVTLQFVISAAQNAWDTNPSISGWTYGEAAKTPVGTAKYGAVKVVYTGKEGDGTDYNSETAPTKAGNYTATFTVTGTEDYSGLSEQVNFTIAKKAVTVTANDAGKTYGESDPALTYTHTELVGSDALVITVARASGENANTYTITASQEDSANPNYEITFKTGIFTIRKAPLTVTVEDKTAIYGDGIPTYTVKYEGFKSGDDKDDLGGALAFECGYAQFSDKGEYTIKASGYTSGNYTISYVDGKLTVNAKPITVTIQNATSVYGDTLAELKATDNGIVNGDTNVYSLATTATGTSNVGKYAITGTALDSNYDVTFVNGEYEITKREITITVDAKNTVVNTTLPTYTYKVEGLVGVDTLVTEPTLTCNANIALIGEYDITASGADAGGNYSIKYVPAKLTVLTDNAVDAAAGYTEELKDYDPATVTSEDKAELEEMLSEINTILADETTTDNGKKALEEVKEQVEKLIKEITDAAEATDTENTEKVENVTPENVIPENKIDLEGAKADLEKALEDNGGNYTEDEKKAIEDELGRIDEALEVIGNVEAVEEGISKLPAVDTVKPDDEETIKAITDAQTAYNALSDYEKSLVDEAAKANLDKLVAALVAYDIVEGDGSSWTEDSNHNITFVVNGLFSKFVGIKVDGKDVDKANYEVKAGSTIITLKASYLDTLAVGEHTITVVYTDGSTDGAFNVHAKANSPATGDDFNITLYASLMAVSVTALVVLLLASKKRKQVK